MSFKNFFINEVPREPTKAPVNPVATTIGGDKPYYAPPAPMGGQIDSKSTDDFNQYLMKLMDDANLPGPDYYEFVKALKGIESLPLTEQQKYVTVFAGFQAQGVTAQSLIDAAQKYIAILGQKKSSEFDTSVASAEASIKVKEDRIKQLVESNEKLSKEMMGNSAEITSLTNQIGDGRAKVEIKKTTFEISFKNFINKIMSDIGNITKYLIDGNATK